MAERAALPYHGFGHVFADGPAPALAYDVSREHTRIMFDVPDSAAVEAVFYAQNVKTALKLSHVRGVVLLTIAEAGLAVGEYSPL